MKPVIILACGHLKEETRQQALYLYKGGYFAATRRWACSVTTLDRIYVLSALHGLISGSAWIEPYDQILTPSRWAELVTLVAQQAPHLLEPCTAVEVPWFCGPAAYADVLRDAGVKVREVTMALPPGRTTRGIGAQLHWYLNNWGRLPDAAR